MSTDHYGLSSEKDISPRGDPGSACCQALPLISPETNTLTDCTHRFASCKRGSLVCSHNDFPSHVFAHNARCTEADGEACSDLPASIAGL